MMRSFPALEIARDRVPNFIKWRGHRVRGSQPNSARNLATVADRISCGATADHPQGSLAGTLARQVYPLVITGGVALPLPISYCAQPAMLRRANIAGRR